MSKTKKKGWLDWTDTANEDDWPPVAPKKNTDKKKPVNKKAVETKKNTHQKKPVDNTGVATKKKTDNPKPGQKRKRTSDANDPPSKTVKHPWQVDNDDLMDGTVDPPSSSQRLDGTRFR